MFPHEESFFNYLVLAWLGLAATTFVALQFLTAPYGRHSRKGWGPTIHRTAGWVIMELPAPAVFLFFFLVSGRTSQPAPLAFTLIWMVHYVNRTLIYPFRMRGGVIPMPLAIVGLGFLFNVLNGYLQGRYLFTLGPVRPAGWLGDARFIAGVTLFAGGYLLNQHADSVLRNLRRPGETGYRIPFGGGYRFVSCPNYLGELLEWTGWAVATWSVSGLVFLIWTAANLVPRARAHHRWYREQFSEYPASRKAVIPFLY